MLTANRVNFDEATLGLKEVGADWMSASQVRYAIQDDLSLVWLNNYGKSHGFEKDDAGYSFLQFIGRKSREFEESWELRMCPSVVQVGLEPWYVRSAEYLAQTCELMEAGVQAVYQAPLWWGRERIYGTPDFIILRSWLFELFPELRVDDGEPDHYCVVDIKFTTELDVRLDKQVDLTIASAQVRLYSYMLGQMQGQMPASAYLVTRDRISSPISVPVSSELGGALDYDLARYRDAVIDVKVNGARYLPWRDDFLRPNFSNGKDEPWHEARKVIATEKIPGRAPELLYQVSKLDLPRLSMYGYDSLDSILAVDPSKVPLFSLFGSNSDKQFAILRAQRTREPSRVLRQIVPPKKPIELFVDYEYVNNLNVDFDAQWPTLDGAEMIFMIGVGWDDEPGWQHRIFAAESETLEGERRMFEQFIEFLGEMGVMDDPKKAALYHWTSAEAWQSERAIKRLGGEVGFELAQILRSFVDLHRAFEGGCIGIPGALDYKLKSVAKALSAHDPRFAVEWPGDLCDGLRAMIMGWEVLKSQDPFSTPEFPILCEYLQADCFALRQLLRWLRQAMPVGGR